MSQRPRRRSQAEPALPIPDDVAVIPKGLPAGYGGVLLERGKDYWLDIEGDRGRTYAKTGKVHSAEVNVGVITGLVTGSEASSYSTRIEIATDDEAELVAWCSCPFASDWRLEWCKHAVALLYVAASAMGSDDELSSRFLGLGDEAVVADVEEADLAVTPAHPDDCAAARERIDAVGRVIDPSAARYRTAAAFLRPPESISALFDPGS